MLVLNDLMNCLLILSKSSNRNLLRLKGGFLRRECRMIFQHDLQSLLSGMNVHWKSSVLKSLFQR